MDPGGSDKELVGKGYWQVFKIFEKSFTNFFLLVTNIRQKNSDFWNQIFKTHVNIEISKMVLPQPQLDIKFLNP